MSAILHRVTLNVYSKRRTLYEMSTEVPQNQFSVVQTNSIC
jgi:hypothetical protein